jgi:hypothetical protein
MAVRQSDVSSIFLLSFPRPTHFKRTLGVNNTAKSYVLYYESVFLSPIFIFHASFEEILNTKTRAGTNLFSPG